MPQIPDQLRSAVLKSERARKQLRDLRSAIRRFRKHEPYGVTGTVEVHNGQREYVWRFQVYRPVPGSFSLIIGDVAHNLRSALDHAYWALWIDGGGSTGSKVYFPIRDAEVDFKTAMVKHRKKISPFRATILEQVQPYQTGFGVLRLLNEIDIADKHQAVHVVDAAGALGGVEIQFPNGYSIGAGESLQLPIGVRLDTIPAGKRVVHGAEALRIPLDQFRGDPEMEVNTQWDLHFIFESPSAADGHNVADTLFRAGIAVRTVIERLATTF